MRRSATEGISMWFFARNDPTVPASIANGADSVTEAELGVPVSTFVSWAQCDLPTFMKPHKFILNLTFCGMSRVDWEESDLTLQADGARRRILLVALLLATLMLMAHLRPSRMPTGMLLVSESTPSASGIEPGTLPLILIMHCKT